MTPRPDLNKRVLRLTLTKKWFDMIASGEKKEEYREIKGYWVSRLTFGLAKCEKMYFFKQVDFDYVEFTNGYGNHRPKMLIECKGLQIGQGEPNWGAPNENVFIIKLGKIISKENFQPNSPK